MRDGENVSRWKGYFEMLRTPFMGLLVTIVGLTASAGAAELSDLVAAKA